LISKLPIDEEYVNEEEMKARTKEFAKRVINLCRYLPDTLEGKLISNQLFRAGTSVGANYRAACQGRSKADFVSKMGIVLEETDETLYWLEILSETEIVRPDLLTSLTHEARELVRYSQPVSKPPGATNNQPNIKCQISNVKWGELMP
jgi:four helix bundle protein